MYSRTSAHGTPMLGYWMAAILVLLTFLPEDTFGRWNRGHRRCRVAQSVCVANMASPLESMKATVEWRTLFDGTSLHGWEIADENEFYQHGNVTVKDGMIEMLMGNPSTGIRRTDDSELLRENYELVFDARRIDGVDFFVGLTFPIAEEYCTLIVGGWGGTILGLSNVDNFAAVDNDTTVTTEFATDRWYQIRVKVSEHKISAWIDKEQVIDLPRIDRKFTIWWEQEPMRPLGIANWFTASQLRDLNVRPLTEAEIAFDAETPRN